MSWIHDGDYRPFIGVMVFIVAITAASMLFAKCCVGDKAFNRTGYDFEGYVMRKFPICVGLPKRTHSHVKETGPPEIEVVVEEVQTSEPPAGAAPNPALPPPIAAAAPAPPIAAAIAAALAAAAAAKEGEDEENLDWMNEDDDEDFNFEEEGDV